MAKGTGYRITVTNKHGHYLKDEVQDFPFTSRGRQEAKAKMQELAYVFGEGTVVRGYRTTARIYSDIQWYCVNTGMRVVLIPRSRIHSKDLDAKAVREVMEAQNVRAHLHSHSRQRRGRD